MKRIVNRSDFKNILNTDWTKLVLSGKRKTIVKIKDQHYRYFDADSKSMYFSYDQFIKNGKNDYEALVLSLLTKNKVCNIKYSMITSTLSVKLSCGKIISIKLDTKDITDNIDEIMEIIIKNYCDNRLLLAKELFQKDKDIVIRYDEFHGLLESCESGAEEYNNRYVFKLIKDTEKLRGLNDYEFLINLIRELVDDASQKLKIQEKTMIINVKQGIDEKPEYKNLNVGITIDFGKRKIDINDPTASLIRTIYDIINEHNKKMDGLNINKSLVKKDKKEGV